MIIRTHVPPSPPLDIEHLGAAQAATLRLLIQTPPDKAPAKGTISARGQVRYKVLDDLAAAGLALRKQFRDRDGTHAVKYVPTAAAKSLARRLLLKKAGNRSRRVVAKKTTQHRRAA